MTERSAGRAGSLSRTTPVARKTCNDMRYQMIVRSLAIATALIALPLAASAQAPDLSLVAFMSGCWQGAFGNNGAVIEESYTASNTQIMLGTTRYIRDGRTFDFEFTRLHADDSGVYLTPYPGGESSVAFRLASSRGGEAVFENLEHDFPKRIIYRRTNGGGLTARIEDDARGREWHMTPTSCGA